jgi:transcriptional regulator with XRE-family HTH domain
MKKNQRLEERRKLIPKEIDLFVTRSFEIVDRIHEILQAKNLDQKDLAMLLSKRESEISKWMSGTHNFTLKTLTRIEDVLGCSVVKILKKEKGKVKEKQPIFLLIDKKYTQINEGNNILVGDLEDFEIKPKFQKLTSYLS